MTTYRATANEREKVKCRLSVVQKKLRTLTASLVVLKDLQRRGTEDPDQHSSLPSAAPQEKSTSPSAPPGEEITSRRDSVWQSDHLTSGTPELLQIAYDKSGVFGRHILVTRAILSAGEMLLLEFPTTKLEMGHTVAGCPEQSDEWLLTHALLAQGKRHQWSLSYVRDERGEIEKSPAVSWLAAELGCSEHDVLAVFRTVANNAFSLDSAVLRIKYGAAFYTEAALLNHSCAPNCHSRRMGGVMAIFSSRAIDAGEELTHSYIPHDVLLAPEPVRAAHLHFRCECSRCCHERADPRIAAAYAALHFPPSHASTPPGKAVGEFKVACVMADAKVFRLEECEHTLTAGDRCLQSNAEFLTAHPIAALEIAVPYLQVRQHICLPPPPSQYRNSYPLNITNLDMHLCRCCGTSRTLT